MGLKPVGACFGDAGFGIASGLVWICAGDLCNSLGTCIFLALALAAAVAS